MYDFTLEMRIGSIRPVIVWPSPDCGVLTVLSGGTFTLLDSTGAIILGPSAVSGFDPGASTSPHVWYMLNAATLLTTTAYSGFFSFQVLGSDGITRTYCPDVSITITAAVEMIATYNDSQLSTSTLFQVRLQVCDTNLASVIWTDNELNYFISLSQGSVTLAASLALEALSIDKAKLSNAVKIGTFGSGEVETFKAITAMAARLRKISVTPAAVISRPSAFCQGWQRGRIGSDPRALSLPDCWD